MDGTREGDRVYRYEENHRPYPCVMLLQSQIRDQEYKEYRPQVPQQPHERKKYLRQGPPSIVQ